MTFYSQSPVRFGSVSMTTATLGPNDPEIGTVISEGDEKYIFVYNNGASQAVPGHGMVATGVTGYSLTISSITHTDVPIGVVKHATIAASAYGWLLQRGFGPAKTGSSVATADAICLGVDGLWVAKLLTTAYSQVVMPTVYGKAMGSAVTGANADVYFNISG